MVYYSQMEFKAFKGVKMKKSHFFILAILSVSVYWILDAYANTALYQTSFASELFLTSPHTMGGVKLLIALTLFGLCLLPLRFMAPPQEKEPGNAKNIAILSRISEILFSSLSIKINVLKSLETFEEMLHLESTLLFVYQKDTLLLYNENEFIKSAFRSKEIFPFRANPSISEVEYIAATCFVEKRPYSNDIIKHNGNTYTLLSVLISEEKSGKPLGNLMLVGKQTKTLMPLLPLVQAFNEMLSFSLLLQSRKEGLEKLNAEVSDENLMYDKTLNIITQLKVQECIENEYKRYKRYHTEVTLVLLEIYMLKNLVSVFPTDVIISLKKDFVNLVRRNIREVDVFGKWKEDEFAILMPNVDFRAAQGLAKKIQQLLEEHKFPRIGKITCNFGITTLAPKDTIGSFRMRCEGALSLAASRDGNTVEVKLLV